MYDEIAMAIDGVRWFAPVAAALYLFGRWRTPAAMLQWTPAEHRKTIAEAMNIPSPAPSTP